MSKRSAKDSKRDTAAVSAAAAEPLSSSLSSSSPRKFDDSSELSRATVEIEKLKKEIATLRADKLQSDEILSTVASQNWDFLMHRCADLRSSFLAQIDNLSADVAALCAFSRKQTELAQSHSRESKKRVEMEKVFRWRDSKLTVMFRTMPEFQTVYHIFIAILLTFMLQVCVHEYFDPRLRLFSFSIIQWNFQYFWDIVMPCWLLMFAIHSTVLPMMWAWRKGLYGNTMYTLLYICLQSFFWIFTGIGISKLHLPIASQLTLLCEQTRMGMKMHSFFRETLRMKEQARARGDIDSPKARDSSRDPEDEELERVNRSLLSDFKEQAQSFLLFHFVPTLIYRNAYPRSRKIRWTAVLTHLFEVVGCILFLYSVFANFCVPQFEKTAAEPGNIQTLLLSITNSMLPAILVYLLAFFGILHCWLNGFAEMTRFADRLFYQDWWNSTSFAMYYRKWNIPVHDWLYNYLYLDLTQLGASRTTAMFSTFIFSAIVHEYIIALGIGFFYPVMLVMFLGFGTGYIYLTKLFIGRMDRFANFFFWFNMILGNGLLMVLYSREYYARFGQYSNPALIDPNSWLPYSWQVFIAKRA